MTELEFKEFLVCNEPDFSYGGRVYSICHPNGNYCVTELDTQPEAVQEFSSVDALLDNCVIQGRPFRDILPQIDI